MYKSIKVFVHIFFWVIYLLFAGAISFQLENNPRFLIEQIDVFWANWVWAAIAFYALYLYGYKYFEQKRFVFYGIMTAGFSGLLVLCFFSLYWLIFSDRNWFSPGLFYSSVAGTFVIANCGSLVKGFEKWFDAVRRKEELEKTNLKLELESLKSQINPHFLFNTLNNIDSQIRSNPDSASESLIRLSDILRYILYAGSEAFVDLEREVEHIENIIALQAQRLTRPSLVHFAKQIQNPHAKVCPLLFTPFIENAFKYALLEEDKPIQIQIHSTDQFVEFTCSNYVDPEKQQRTPKSGGIGLANVKRRLELLYPMRHSLEIQAEKHTFSILLRIQIPAQ